MGRRSGRHNNIVCEQVRVVALDQDMTTLPKHPVERLVVQIALVCGVVLIDAFRLVDFEDSKNLLAVRGNLNCENWRGGRPRARLQWTEGTVVYAL